MNTEHNNNTMCDVWGKSMDPKCGWHKMLTPCPSRAFTHSSLCIRLFTADGPVNHQSHSSETPFQIIPLNPPPLSSVLGQSTGNNKVSTNISESLSSQSSASSATLPSQSLSASINTVTTSTTTTSNTNTTTTNPSSATSSAPAAQNASPQFASGGGGGGDSCSSAGSSSRLSVVSLNASFANASSAGDRSSSASTSTSHKHGSSSTSSDHTLVQSHGGLDDSIGSQHSDSSQHAVINLGKIRILEE